MNILYLTGDKYDSVIYNFLNRDGNQIIEMRGKFEPSFLKTIQVDWIVSYGYRHILEKPVVDFMRWRIVNLHIQLLPWNRGADPNFWSWVEDTPKGVSVHFIDEGIDTGNIIAQKEVRFEGDVNNLTLYDTYNILKKEVEDLFMGFWAVIKRADFGAGRLQEGAGTYHERKDIERYRPCLTKGWLTRIGVLLDNIKKLNV